MTRVYCHRCEAVTEWVPLRGRSVREKCVGCGDRFPCRSCNHVDCVEARVTPTEESVKAQLDQLLGAT